MMQSHDYDYIELLDKLGGRAACLDHAMMEDDMQTCDEHDDTHFDHAEYTDDSHDNIREHTSNHASTCGI